MQNKLYFTYNIKYNITIINAKLLFTSNRHHVTDRIDLERRAYVVEGARSQRQEGEGRAHGVRRRVRVVVAALRGKHFFLDAVEVVCLENRLSLGYAFTDLKYI